MADTATAKPAKGSAFWTHKLGPFPVWVWGAGVGIVGVYYWYTHYGPGASKQQPGQQQPGQQRPGQPAQRVRITETIRRFGGGGRRGGGRRRPADRNTARAGGGGLASASAAPADGSPGLAGTMAGVPAPPPNPGGPNVTPGGRLGGGRRGGGDRDHDRDDARRRGEVISRQEVRTTTRTGQPVSPETGQPVYWEWQHVHRPPEIATPIPVPEPQQAYAPMTPGAQYGPDTAAAG